MRRKVLIVPDKFKGTLTAAQAAEAIERGWRRSRPEDTLLRLPMSDGGDGFGIVLGNLLGATRETIATVDAAHRPAEASWWWHAGTSTAVIESAQAVGLAALPRGVYHPFELDTEGLGALLLAAQERGARRCLVGIGGSATNDGGFGLARALGWLFFNDSGERMERWTELHRLSQMRPPDSLPTFEDLSVAVDVQNTLLGPSGCTRVYGPQKGLQPAEFEFAERCLEKMAEVLERELHLACTKEPGTGAAGGLGFGLRCFAGAHLAPGFELFAQTAGLDEKIDDADLVLTGEGALDASTLMGKGVGQLAGLCRQRRVPCIAFAGMVPNRTAALGSFTQAYALTPDLVRAEEAIARAEHHLEQLTAKAAAEYHE
jgi:glycerate kinase